MRKIHLISNAHLDPVWLWEWEEGAAAAVSTFRSAADLCERNPDFVFNHNEALLYEWVEEYEPALFKRIRRLVTAGRWHVMGGWFLQPDCNMPSGESFLRQIGYGRRYFWQKFGIRPTTAMNFDPFGHSRGLVQILARCGYDSYLFCRPGPKDPGQDLRHNVFRWIGFDGSEVIASRAWDHYLSLYGQARAKVEKHLAARSGPTPDYVLWGVGNHGGGPSALDLADLEKLRASRSDVALVHSTPEAFFAELREHHRPLPVRSDHLNPWGVGCYTSQVRIKQRHRQLENALSVTEKMCTVATFNRLMPYPATALADAERDLLFAQFHDILPGSSVPSVEEQSLRLMDHGLETLARIRARAFFALTAGQPPAAVGTIPIMVFNPHPHPVQATIECEFQLENQNHGKTWTVFDVLARGQALPAQTEQEASNINLDWRKRVVFRAELAAGTMNRFDCSPRILPAKPAPTPPGASPTLRFQFENGSVAISRRSGLIQNYQVGNVSLLRAGAVLPTVFRDNGDPWHMRSHLISQPVGTFRLLRPKEAGAYSGLKHALAPVRIIESGPVRTVVEALFGFRCSRLRLRYVISRQDSEIGLEICVNWQEPDLMLKLAVPCRFNVARFLGQTAYGTQDLSRTGDEAVALQWVSALAPRAGGAVTVCNDGTYGFSLRKNTLHLNLLRSPAYAAHPIGRRPLLPSDRLTPRIDQGERTFRFWLNGGATGVRMASISREALVHNEAPVALSFFPSGFGRSPAALVEVSNPRVVLTAFRYLPGKHGYLMRLFESTGRSVTTMIHAPSSGFKQSIRLKPFEFRTYVFDRNLSRMQERDPFGQPL